MGSLSILQGIFPANVSPVAAEPTKEAQEYWSE